MILLLCPRYRRCGYFFQQFSQNCDKGPVNLAQSKIFTLYREHIPDWSETMEMDVTGEQFSHPVLQIDNFLYVVFQGFIPNL